MSDVTSCVVPVHAPGWMCRLEQQQQRRQRGPQTRGTAPLSVSVCMCVGMMETRQGEDECRVALWWGHQTVAGSTASHCFLLSSFTTSFLQTGFLNCCCYVWKRGFFGEAWGNKEGLIKHASKCVTWICIGVTAGICSVYLNSRIKSCSGAPELSHPGVRSRSGAACVHRYKTPLAYCGHVRGGHGLWLVGSDCVYFHLHV